MNECYIIENLFGKIFFLFNDYLILFVMRSSMSLMKIENTRYKISVKKKKKMEKSECN